MQEVLGVGVLLNSSEVFLQVAVSIRKTMSKELLISLQFKSVHERKRVVRLDLVVVYFPFKLVLVI